MRCLVVPPTSPGRLGGSAAKELPLLLWIEYKDINEHAITPEGTRHDHQHGYSLKREERRELVEDSLRGSSVKHWNDAENISMPPAQG
jgi:hypothetical protein